jgi:hypothetical protein
MSGSARTIHLPGANALSELRQRVVGSLDDWAREWIADWNGSRHTLVVKSFLADQDPQPAGYEWLRSESGAAWVRGSAADRAQFGRAVVGFELMPRLVCADEWIADIVATAWEARNRALCAALLGSPLPVASASNENGLPNALYLFGAGAVQLSCDLLGLYAVADASVWRTVPPPEHSRTALPGIAKLDRAMGNSRVALEVVLGGAEIDLSKLLDLRVGDVLRLSQKLDRPAAVVCGANTVAHALLGESGGRKAAQLIA